MSVEKNKSWRMTRNQSFIAAAVFVGFFVLWFLWAAVGQSVLCWIEDHPGVASWIQAVGSIAAILATLFVFRSTIENSRRDSEEKDKKLIINYLFASLDYSYKINQDMGRERINNIEGFRLKNIKYLIDKVSHLDKFEKKISSHKQLVVDLLFSSKGYYIFGEITKIINVINSVEESIVHVRRSLENMQRIVNDFRGEEGEININLIETLQAQHSVMLRKKEGLILCAEKICNALILEIGNLNSEKDRKTFNSRFVEVFSVFEQQGFVINNSIMQYYIKISRELGVENPRNFRSKFNSYNSPY